MKLQLKFGVVGVGVGVNDNLESFSCILFKFVMHVTNKQFSDKLNNGWKNFKMALFIAIFRIFRQ